MRSREVITLLTSPGVELEHVGDDLLLPMRQDACARAGLSHRQDVGRGDLLVALHRHAEQLEEQVGADA